MNPVEIEQAISTLAELEFDPAEFPFAFLTAFGNKETTIKRLRSGATNKSDLGGVLQTNNIHIATCAPGKVAETLSALKGSPATAKAKAKYVLATDGIDFQAEDTFSDDPPIVCAYKDFPDHFGFFLSLAGITTVRQVRESSFDIRATSRLNKLYVELLKDNPDWGTAKRRPDMNHFMARLIFCFFAEDTDIFIGGNLFTATIDKMTARDSSDNRARKARRLFSIAEDGKTIERQAININAYLAAGPNIIVRKESAPISGLPKMIFGNKVVDGGHLRLSQEQLDALDLSPEDKKNLVRRIHGSADFIRGETVYCLWIADEHLADAERYPAISAKIEAVRSLRLASPDKSANQMAARAHQFREMRNAREHTIVLPRITSEGREFLPVGIADSTCVISSQNFGLFDEPIWVLSILASRLHIAWIAAVCGRLELRFMYSNTLCWNTFPVLALTEKNKADLTRCAEDILLAREAHFPATIADLYDPESMPADLRDAHERNDEVLERIYIGRRFRNDTERLEKLFELYTKMTANAGGDAKTKPKVVKAK